MKQTGKTVKKIDCHTHIITPQIRDEYFSRTNGYALVMQLPESIMKNPQTLETVLSDGRLFLCPAIDIKKPVPPQLDALEPHLDEYKVVGLKIYLTYQRGRADEERFFPVYEFAARHRLAVTFHTGLCSLVLPSDNDMEGSDAKHIEKAAKKYPEVAFVAAHLDDPRFFECAEILARNDNIYSDISGAYETGTKEGNDVNGAIETFKKALRSQPGLEKKILYGTDFCPPLNMAQLEEYDITAERIFSPAELENVYFNNALRAFPRLAEMIGIK